MGIVAATDERLNRRAETSRNIIRRIAIVAGLGVGLGIAMQIAIVLLRLLGGQAPNSTAIAGLLQTVTWSTLVCTGVAVGMALGKARAALASVYSAVFAPLALTAAKGVEKLIASLMNVANNPGVLSIATIGVVRALEYGLLAWLLAWLSQRNERRLLPYGLAGGGVGVFFGGTILLMTYVASGLDETGRNYLTLASTAIAEIGSPLGCAFVIYVAQFVGTHMRLWSRGSRSNRSRKD